MAVGSVWQAVLRAAAVISGDVCPMSVAVVATPECHVLWLTRIDAKRAVSYQ